MSAFEHVPPHAMRSAVLPEDERAALLEWALGHQAALTPSRVTGDIHKPGGREAFSFYGDPPWKRWLTERIDALLPGILPELGMPAFVPSGFEVELVAYTDGCFIARHRDTGTGMGRHKQDRIVSMIYYLHREPKGFDGGELRLWPLMPAPSGAQGFVDIAPLQNGLVAFPSWAVHEVLPVQVPSQRYDDARFAINVWAQRAHA